MRLEGKVAIISGSTRGIGRTTAEMFAREGAKVAVTGRTVDRGEKVVARIKEAGGEAAFWPLDTFPAPREGRVKVDFIPQRVVAQG